MRRGCTVGGMCIEYSIIRVESAARILGVSVAYIEGLALVGIVESTPDKVWLPLSSFEVLRGIQHSTPGK
jgi:hypothetical protein